MRSFKVSLIISTYNSPEYLKLCLKSVFSQVELPDEIIIADDGSKEAVMQEIDEFVKSSPVPVQHVWQPDEGFQLSKIRNKAISRATGEYILQIDGDMILHPYFIKDHITNARKGYYVRVSRCYIEQDYSKQLLSTQTFSYKDLPAHLSSRYKSLRIPLLTKMLKYVLARNKKKILGGNMAYWREDALRINGYNEDFVGWGREDNDFAIRLNNIGTKKMRLKFSAIAYHIHHKSASRDNLSENDKLLKEVMTTGKKWTDNGITKVANHLS